MVARYEGKIIASIRGCIEICDDGVLVCECGPIAVSPDAQGSGIDGKTALQELASERGLSIPIYEIAESGPDHDKSFTAIAIVSQEKFDVGQGKSKREAEQMAARLALAELLDRRQKQS